MVNILGVISTIFRSIKRKTYRSQIRKVAKEVGENLKVNFKSRVNKNTFLGNNVNFNGLVIRGDGEVVIGDNFHSDPDILLLTRNLIMKEQKYLMMKLLTEKK